mgnify:CR=1 FL=1
MKEIELHKLRDKEIGYLVGLFVGDGYANHHQNSRHYTVEFSLNRKKDRSVIKKVLKILKKSNINVYKIKDKRCRSMKLRIHSKALMNFLVSRKKELFNKKYFWENYKLGLLSGYIDAEGKVIGTRKILVQEKKLRLLRLIEKFCKSLDISTTKIATVKINGKKNRQLIASGFKGLKHNSVRIRSSYRK